MSSPKLFDKHGGSVYNWYVFITLTHVRQRQEAFSIVKLKAWIFKQIEIKTSGIGALFTQANSSRAILIFV